MIQPRKNAWSADLRIDLASAIDVQDLLQRLVHRYQLIGGVGYQLNPNLGLYAEGRWFQTESGEFDGPGSESFDGEFETFDLLVGMRYVFSPAM